MTSDKIPYSVSMINKRVAVITIQVNCDPVPGAAHDAADWSDWFLKELTNRCPWYEPKILSCAEKFIEKEPS